MSDKEEPVGGDASQGVHAHASAIAALNEADHTEKDGTIGSMSWTFTEEITDEPR